MYKKEIRHTTNPKYPDHIGSFYGCTIGDEHVYKIKEEEERFDIRTKVVQLLYSRVLHGIVRDPKSGKVKYLREYDIDKPANDKGTIGHIRKLFYGR